MGSAENGGSAAGVRVCDELEDGAIVGDKAEELDVVYGSADGGRIEWMSKWTRGT
jgi:hypothetical protein